MSSIVALALYQEFKTRIKATWRKTVSSLAQIREQMCLKTHFQYEFSFLGRFGHSGLQIKNPNCHKYRPITNERENVYSKFLLIKCSKKYFIFSSAYYLIIWDIMLIWFFLLQKIEKMSRYCSGCDRLLTKFSLGNCSFFVGGVSFLIWWTC